MSALRGTNEKLRWIVGEAVSVRLSQQKLIFGRRTLGSTSVCSHDDVGLTAFVWHSKEAETIIIIFNSLYLIGDLHLRHMPGSQFPHKRIRINWISLCAPGHSQIVYHSLPTANDPTATAKCCKIHAFYSRQIRAVVITNFGSARKKGTELEVFQWSTINYSC